MNTRNNSCARRKAQVCKVEHHTCGSAFGNLRVAEQEKTTELNPRLDCEKIERKIICGDFGHQKTRP